jgi:hypothetical protein
MKGYAFCVIEFSDVDVLVAVRKGDVELVCGIVELTANE